MAEEQFFPMFRERLREEVRKFQKKKELSNLFAQHYYKYWNPCDSCKESDYPIIACDGSLGSSSFSGGVIFWVARAIAHTYVKGSLIKTTPEVEVRGGYRLEGRTFFMKAVELKTLNKATGEALNEYGGALAVYDGSLYFTFFHHRPHMGAIKEILKEYVSELSSLLELGMRDNVKIIGVVKDSDINYLRSHIINLLLLEDGIERIGYYRNIKQMREEMEKQGLLGAKSLKDYLKEIENDESDEAFYNAFTEKPGFTTPLLLAPQICYAMQEVKGGRRRWSESRFRARAPESFIPLIKEIDRLYDLPPVALTYWKPKHKRRTYRLDIPSCLLGCDIKCDDLNSDEFVDRNGNESMRNLVAILNWLDREAYGIRPLVDVDEIVRLTRKRYKSSYEPIIHKELKLHGHNFKPRKRDMRDDFMRRF